MSLLRPRRSTLAVVESSSQGRGEGNTEYVAGTVRSQGRREERRERRK